MRGFFWCCIYMLPTSGTGIFERRLAKTLMSSCLLIRKSGANTVCAWSYVPERPPLFANEVAKDYHQVLLMYLLFRSCPLAWWHSDHEVKPIFPLTRQEREKYKGCGFFRLFFWFFSGQSLWCSIFKGEWLEMCTHIIPFEVINCFRILLYSLIDLALTLCSSLRDFFSSRIIEWNVDFKCQ